MKKRIGFALIISLALALMAGQSWASSRSWTFPENNNKIIEVQKKGGDPSLAGPVKIDYFGHCAFRITSPDGITVLIDPWRNDPSGAWGLWYPNKFPEVPVSIVMSTHAHFDHDAVYRPHGRMVFDRLAGEYRLGDVKIIGLADKHQCKAPGWYGWTKAIYEFNQDPCPPNNAMHMDNYIYILETGGLRIAHWGDNRPNPPAHVWKGLKDIDVLLLTIDDSQHILSYEQIDAVLNQVKPKIVIPTHYQMKGVSSVLTTLQTADKWVDKQVNVEKPAIGSVTLNPEEVKALKGDVKVLYFGSNFVTE